jgi:hypothetical protein
VTIYLASDVAQEIKDGQGLDEQVLNMLWIIQANGPSWIHSQVKGVWNVQDGIVVYGG